VVREILASPDVRTGVEFAAEEGLLADVSGWAGRRAPMGPLAPPSLLVTEPPDHTRYRRLVTRVFSVRAVEGLRRHADTVATGLLDEFEADVRRDPDTVVELVDAYCNRLAVTVIAEILGVPEADRPRILELASAAAPSLDLALSWRTFRRAERALTEFDDWLGGHLEHVRRHPGHELLSQLVAARDHQADGTGAGLTDRELKSTAGLVLAAGFETTADLIGNGIHLLLRHPEQLARLRADPGLWPRAVDEVLRLDPSVTMTVRIATRDTEIAGTTVPRGALLTTLLGGANRDPAVFENPDTLDVTRPNADQHVSFSAGRHYCLGAALARMEGEVGLRSFFDRFPDVELLPGARRRATRVLQGYAALPARLGPPR